MKPFNCTIVLTLVVALLGAGGCGDPTVDAGSPADAAGEHAGHAHEPPNGGVPIAIGDEEFHLELVHTAGEPLMSAYILDGHLEDYVRLSQPSFEVKVTLPGSEQVLTFHAVADRATGETVGDTAFFQAEADWLKEVTTFDGAIPSLEIRSNTYQDIGFKYPEGNDARHEH